jgi:hypothetical protein
MVDVAIRTRVDATDDAVRDALLAGFPSARRGCPEFRGI